MVDATDGARPRRISVGGGVEVVFHLDGAGTDGRFSVVEHPLAPGALIEPHTHQREDEYSFVLSGTVGMLLADREFEATVGTMVAKPRGVPHAAWNAGAEPASFLEIISPPGFEQFFPAVADLFAGPTEPSGDALEQLAERYHLAFDLSSVNDLIDRHNLTAAARYD